MNYRFIIKNIGIYFLGSELIVVVGIICDFLNLILIPPFLYLLNVSAIRVNVAYFESVANLCLFVDKCEKKLCFMFLKKAVCRREILSNCNKAIKHFYLSTCFISASFLGIKEAHHSKQPT